MTIINFEKVQVGSKKICKCLECGKKLKRAATFEQTINPFNKNIRGEIKTRGEIFMELTAEAEKWKPEVNSCEDHN